MYRIRATPPRNDPAAERAVVLDALNTGNSEMRWPKAYLVRAGEPSLLQVVAERQRELPAGLDPAAMDHFSLRTIEAADSFFTWLEAESWPTDFTELELWLRDAG